MKKLHKYYNSIFDFVQVIFDYYEIGSPRWSVSVSLADKFINTYGNSRLKDMFNKIINKDEKRGTYLLISYKMPRKGFGLSSFFDFNETRPKIEYSAEDLWERFLELAEENLKLFEVRREDIDNFFKPLIYDPNPRKL